MGPANKPVARILRVAGFFIINNIGYGFEVKYHAYRHMPILQESFYW